MKFIVTGVRVFAILAGLSTALTVPSEPCPFHQTDSHELAADTYLVMLKKGHSLDAHFKVIGKDLSAGATHFNYESSINTYHAVLDSETVHQLIRYDPGVRLVQQDSYQAHHNSTHHGEVDDLPSSHDLRKRYGTMRQGGEPWWHVEITNGAKVADPSTADRLPASWYSLGGRGVDVYVLDSGIYSDHAQLRGRVSAFRGLTTSLFTQGPIDDHDSHGTHVASVIARVVPMANIINVKVSCARANMNPEPNCKPLNGALAMAIAAVASDHNTKRERPPPGWRGSVINVSAGTSGYDLVMSDAVQEATKAGVPIAAAAGNADTDKIGMPCSMKLVKCVSASDKYYKKVESANYGKRVNVIAPGSFIAGAGIDTYNQVTYKTGTSQATPMVAGAMAIFVGYEGLKDNINAVYERVDQNAIRDIVTGFDSATANYFLNTGINNKYKVASDPYAGVYHDSELKIRSPIASNSVGAVVSPTTVSPNTVATVVSANTKGTVSPSTVATVVSANTRGTVSATSAATIDPLDPYPLPTGNPLGDVSETLALDTSLVVPTGYAIVSTLTAIPAVGPQYLITATFAENAPITAVSGVVDPTYSPDPVSASAAESIIRAIVGTAPPF